MADQIGEVVIRSDDGTEHVFPPGFDPKKAADIVRQQSATVGTHPEAKIGSTPSDAPVTLGDLKDDPLAAMQRIGTILKKDLTDPKLWMTAAAAYFAPKIFEAAAPTVARAVGGAIKQGPTLVQGAKFAADLARHPVRTVAGAVVDELAKRMPVAKPGAEPFNAPRLVTPPSEPVAAAPTAAPAPNTFEAAGISPARQEELAQQLGGTAPSAAESGTALQRAKAAFSAIKETPGPAEASNAASLIARGKTPKDAVAQIIASRSAPVGEDAAAVLARKLGTPSEATVTAAVKARNQTGRW